jgi:hypothetical protein
MCRIEISCGEHGFKSGWGCQLAEVSPVVYLQKPILDPETHLANEPMRDHHSFTSIV